MPGIRVVISITEPEVDVATSIAVRDATLAAITQSVAELIVIDLGLINFLDSTGITALIACHRLAISQGSQFALANPNRIVRRVLEVSGLLASGVFDVVDI